MPVNLLTVVPTVVAVSSTVDNRTILPEHLVDGKLDTAWNSRTNDLAGAWVAVRVPSNAHVDEIRLTAGFTKVDKKLGDLFTMNPRIKKVRVSRDGKVLFEKELDVENRGLQVLSINAAGGDYKVEVIDFVAGSKKTWREMPISELEVWGTTPTPGASKPVVRIGSLDRLPPTQAECAKALGVTDKVVAFSTLELAGELAVCRVDSLAAGADENAVAVAVVKRATRLTMIATLPALAAYQKEGLMEGPYDTPHNADREISLATMQLATDDIVLRVDDKESRWDPINVNANTKTTLYRLAGGELKPVLAFESTDSSSDGVGTVEECDVTQPDIGPKMAAKLVVHCTKRSNEPYPGKTTKTTQRDVRYRWDGSAYAK